MAWYCRTDGYHTHRDPRHSGSYHFSSHNPAVSHSSQYVSRPLRTSPSHYYNGHPKPHSHTEPHSCSYTKQPHSHPSCFQSYSRPHLDTNSRSHQDPHFSQPHAEPHFHQRSDPYSYYSDHSHPEPSIPHHCSSAHHQPSTPSLLSVTHRYPPQYCYSQTPLSTRSYDTSWTALPNGYHHETVPHNAIPPSPSWSAGEELSEELPLENKAPLTEEIEESKPHTVSTGEQEYTTSLKSEADSATRHTKEVRLKKWYLRMHGNSVLVAGFNKEKRQNWKSGPIVERNTPHQVVTLTGSVYNLEGDMNSSALSKELLITLGEKFKNGFPASWRLDVATVMWNMKNVKKEKQEEISSKQSQCKDTPDIKPQLKETEPKAKSPMPSPSLGFLSSLKKSSRGRTIKPVLSTFNSTCRNLFSYGYSYSGTGEVMGINTSVVDLTLDDCEFSSDELFITKKESKKIAIEATSHKSEQKAKKPENCMVKSSAPVSPLLGVAKFDRSPVIKISRISCDTPVAKPTPCKQQRKRRKRITMPKTKKKIATDTEDEEFSCHEQRERNWTEADKSKLRSVVHSVPTLNADFWAEVAHKMNDSFTPSDCQTVYNQLSENRLIPTTTKKQTKGKEKAKSGRTVITGKPGTLKRKIQLRSALEEMDEGHHDDIFEYSQPVTRQMKRVKINTALFDDDEEEEEVSVDSSSLKGGVGAPTAAVCTPGFCDVLKDDNFDVNSQRQIADKQVYRYNKLKRGKDRPLGKQNGVKQPVAKPQLKKKHLKDIRAGEQQVMSHFEPTSDDGSSDSETAFNDMMEAYKELSKRFK